MCRRTPVPAMRSPVAAPRPSVRLALAAALVAALLLAGCAHPAATGDGTAQTPTSSAPTEESRDARVATSPASASASAASANQSLAIDWDGDLATFVCAPTGTGSCSGAGLPPMHGGSDWTQEAAPAAWTGTLTLTWTPATPATQQLRLSLQSYDSCGAHCTQSVGKGISVAGPSPLTLEVSGLEGRGAGLWASVGATNLAPAPLVATAAADQPFHLSGTLAGGPTPPA